MTRRRQVPKDQTSQFNFTLPRALIAQHPVRPRDHSRLLVVDRARGTITHDVFYHLPQYLQAGDCIVVNNSRVVPFRLHGIRKRSDARGIIQAKVELLLLRETASRHWEALARPAKKLQPGDVLEFGKGSTLLAFTVVQRIQEGRVEVATTASRDMVFSRLEKIGEMPTPPYVTERLRRKKDYQTVYATSAGSAAAPTAGLHFTPRTFRDLARVGVSRAEVTLHVGLGTFLPITAPSLSKHHMHAERIFLSASCAKHLRTVQKEGHRIVAVGTTALRTLESCSLPSGKVQPTPRAGRETDIFITPGYTFRAVDALLTNFHLPESTLFVLVCAFAGTALMQQAYAEAIRKKYRFFSFGDAMLIL